MHWLSAVPSAGRTAWHVAVSKKQHRKSSTGAKTASEQHQTEPSGQHPPAHRSPQQPGRLMLTNHNWLIYQPANCGFRITFGGAGSRELARLGVRCRSKATRCLRTKRAWPHHAPQQLFGRARSTYAVFAARITFLHSLTGRKQFWQPISAAAAATTNDRGTLATFGYSAPGCMPQYSCVRARVFAPA